MIHFKNYAFDEERFLLSLSKGDTYKTDSFNIEKRSSNSYLTYSSTLLYKISEEFILENYAALIAKNIIIPNKK
ncbi:hypothetical protein [Fusobacterium necrophorum]|uniref:Uncharacterized protein n=1 Tax=Fusobacterium necrophorum TaxID=859 RepID=A0A4Q2L031_9FUSO|nr:hypothetical protein [Fusobacterium necrophorum]RXZ70697.1 hypothetical protein EPT53_03170 [Fusobacterium necrophorum]